MPLGATPLIPKLVTHKVTHTPCTAVSQGRQLAETSPNHVVSPLVRYFFEKATMMVCVQR